jgi:uncharacterized membrane protein
MSLTYQPFAETSQIQDLRNDLQMNVPDRERTLSALAGGVLIIAALTGGKLAKWLLLTAGAALVRRAWLGDCPWYRRLGADPRHRPSEHL